MSLGLLGALTSPHHSSSFLWQKSWSSPSSSLQWCPGDHHHLHDHHHPVTSWVGRHVFNVQTMWEGRGHAEPGCSALLSRHTLIRDLGSTSPQPPSCVPEAQCQLILMKGDRPCKSNSTETSMVQTLTVRELPTGLVWLSQGRTDTNSLRFAVRPAVMTTLWDLQIPWPSLTA